MKTYKRWTQVSIFLILFALITITLLNYVIDPHNVFRTNTHPKINARKIELNEYLIKARDIVQQKPDVIFLGSSRVRIGLDPQYYKLLTGEPAYNAGLSSSNLEVQLSHLNYALLNNPDLKRVFLGLDFAAFKENANRRNVQYNDERLQTKWFTFDDWTQQTISISATKDSLKVLKDNWYGTNKYTTNHYAIDGSHNEQSLLPIRQEMLLKGENYFYNHLESYLGEKGHYRNYKHSDVQMDALKQIIELCKEKKIELYLFINPAHAMQWEAIELKGIWDEFEQWKYELVAITPVWDFSGFHTVSTTPPDTFDDFTDQSHYRKHIGNYIFLRLLHMNEDQVPSDFGKLLTAQNIDEHLSAIREQKGIWEASNVDIVQRMKELYPIAE